MIWIAPSEKDHANGTLEKRLWAGADQFRANSGLMLLEQANREVYRLFKDGIPVSVADTGDSTPLDSLNA